MTDIRTLNNRYTLEAEIGRGGMGVVYRAEDAQVKRTVAIKTLPSLMTHNQELLRRFNSEVQHASKLSHPNIVRVFDVGEDAGTHYYVMQYIDGKSLRELQKEKGRFTLEEALPILEQVATALDYAHSQGIVHRDIKPENILIDQDGHAFVLDFGIAKAAEGTRTTRGMLGTPEYMSPEQIKGQAVDGRSDQYSLAVVAYEMLTGRTPFQTEGDDPWAQIQKHLNERVVDPRKLGIALPNNAVNTLLKALDKSSQQRFERCLNIIYGLKGQLNVANSSVTYWIRRPYIKWLGAPGIVIVSVLLWLTWHCPMVTKHFIESKHTIKPVLLRQVVYVDYGHNISSLISSDINGKAKSRICWLEKLLHDDFDGYGKDLIPIISSNANAVIYNYDVTTIREQSTVRNIIMKKVNLWDHVPIYALSSDGNIVLYSVSVYDNSREIISLYIKNISNNSSIMIGHMRSEFWGGDIGANNPCSVEGKGGGSVFVWPALSRSGRYAVFCNDKGILCIYDCLQKTTTGICNIGLYGPQPQFSQDERTIVYSDGHNISMVGIDGCNPVNIASVSENDGYIEYISFVNRQIAYVVNPKINFNPIGHFYFLNIISIGQKEPRQLLKTTEHIRCPMLDVDEQRIAYCQVTDTGYYHVFIRSLDTNITIDIGRGIAPVWVVTKQLLGHDISNQEECPSELPKGYEYISNISADFDGDGSNETAYYGMSLINEPIICIVKNGKLIWKYDFKSIHDTHDTAIGTSPIILTSAISSGDNIPKLVCHLHSQSLYSAGISNDIYIIFGYSKGIYNRLYYYNKDQLYIKNSKSYTIDMLAQIENNSGNVYLVKYFKWNGSQYLIDHTGEINNIDRNKPLNLPEYVKLDAFFAR